MTAAPQVETSLPLRLVQIPPSSPDYEFVISVNNLPEKFGFSAEFQAKLEAVGDNLQILASKLLNSYNLADSGEFKAG